MEPKAGDWVFVDTNVLLTATDRSRPQHEESRTVIARAGRAGLHLAASGQILREYLVVATRPVEVNGLGMAPPDAVTNAERFLRGLSLLEESELVSTRVRELTRSCGLSGKRIHDANVAATALVHGVAFLLTGNPDDFSPFPELRLLDVGELARRLAG
jgi:predicted nucleic acid-binding protein